MRAPVQWDVVRRGDPLNEWRVAVACVLLARVRGDRARDTILRLLQRWPAPALLAYARTSHLVSRIHHLGCADRRAALLRALSRAWLLGARGRALPGVGPYGEDSIRMFCSGDYRTVPKSRDHVLMAWRRHVLRLS